MGNCKCKDNIVVKDAEKIICSYSGYTSIVLSNTIPEFELKDFEEGKHEIIVEVKDNCGNENIDSFTIYVDKSKPNIESIEIQPLTSDDHEAVINYFDYGTFYNEAVRIVVKVNDSGNGSLEYFSGIESVEIGGHPAQLIEGSENEYAIEVALDDVFEDMQIVVKDEVELETIKPVKDISDEDRVISNLLMIENEKPTVSFGDFLNLGYRDNRDAVWFGSNEKDVNLEITVADTNGKIKSGLYFWIFINMIEKMIPLSLRLQRAGTTLVSFSKIWPATQIIFKR